MFDEAIGRKETSEDRIDRARMAQAAAMLGLGEEGINALARDGAPLPPLFHLFFTNNPTDATRLSPDGHEILGRFIPDVTTAGPFHRRMWAAGDMRFEGSITVGETIRRVSTITAIARKEGSTGPLVFVTVDREMEGRAGKVMETRTIVYREKGQGDAPDSLPLKGDETLTEKAAWRPDHGQLFRFSALTWNTHRIHYDADHCRHTEGYPDIITHGPFTAMHLALLAAGGLGPAAGDALISGGADRMATGDASARRLSRFRFRGTQALYVARRVGLCASDDFTRLEARNHQGQQAMTATAEFTPAG
ncbi:MaoC family dehydratase N-terminal domain-containing protein [Alphaproteobacteria bacterium LSUCC0684]